MDLSEYVGRPLAALGAIAGSWTAVFEPAVLEAILAALWASAGTLFTAMSLGAFTLPRVFPGVEPYVPILKGLFAGALALYGVKLLAQLYGNFEKEL